MAESPEEYAERTSRDAMLAGSLNVAPGSPAFYAAIREMKSDILSTGGFSEEEADTAVRDAFAIAKAEQNKRREGKP